MNIAQSLIDQMPDTIDTAAPRVFMSDSAGSILLIDDDVKYCRLIAQYLGAHGFVVTLAHDGKVGLEKATSDKFDAVLLDIMLPGLQGGEVLRSVRETSEVPILMLTALGEEADRIVGLELGADDYLPKSFSPREILARLRAVMRRISRTGVSTKMGDTVVVGSLSIEPATRKVSLNDKPIRLTAVEFDLLLSLARAKGRIKTRDQLLNDIQSVSTDAYDRSIDVHVSMLRKKLNDDAKNPCLIKTIRSVGYSLADESELEH
jgi:DNA-binding response OmpR family regulator